MKKLFVFVVAICVLLTSTVAFADVDLNGLSYDELVELVNKAQLEMMKSDKWQEVIVPEGIYKIGEDIPAGKWTVSAPQKVYVVSIVIGSSMYDEFTVNFDKYVSLHGPGSALYNEGETSFVTLDLKEGMYIQIQSGSAIFSPYSGNSFSFK